MSPETAFVESPCLCWGVFVIVVEFVDGLGGEVAEVLVRALPADGSAPSSMLRASRESIRQPFVHELRHRRVSDGLVLPFRDLSKPLLLRVLEYNIVEIVRPD